MKRFLHRADIKQFLSYFCVGGSAAIVEWLVFYLLDQTGLSYLISTVAAFVTATLANWILGRKLTFRNSACRYRRKTEILLVFLVSAIGLMFNMILMYIFVSVIGMNQPLWKTGAKMLSTGIVFIWNYLSRKRWIYRNE